MSETSLLDGKVVVRSLPALGLPVPAGAPTLKRLLLAQGELAQFHDNDEGMRYIAFIELLAGQARGNHYHRVKEELVYMIRGEVVLWVADIASDTRASVPLRTGDLAMIKTGVAHTLQVVEAGQAIECSAARFDATDIYRYPLV